MLACDRVYTCMSVRTRSLVRVRVHIQTYAYTQRTQNDQMKAWIVESLQHLHEVSASLLVCVCARAHFCVRVCVCACARARLGLACECTRACSHACLSHRATRRYSGEESQERIHERQAGSHICMHACTFTHNPVHARAQAGSHACKYTHARTQAYAHAWARAHAWTRTQLHAHKCTHARTQPAHVCQCTHACKHTHTHTCTHALMHLNQAAKQAARARRQSQIDELDTGSRRCVCGLCACVRVRVHVCVRGVRAYIVRSCACVGLDQVARRGSTVRQAAPEVHRYTHARTCALTHLRTYSPAHLLTCARPHVCAHTFAYDRTGWAEGREAVDDSGTACGMVRPMAYSDAGANGLWR